MEVKYIIESRDRRWDMRSRVGSKFYYAKGYIRVQVKADRRSILMLKSLSIDEEKSIVTVTGEAISWILENANMVPSTFPSPSEPKSFFTFVNRDDHKRLKKLCAILNRPLCEVTGFIITIWAQANGQT